MKNKENMIDVNKFANIPFVPSGNDFKYCGSLGLIDLFYRSHNCQFLELADDMIKETGCFYFWDFWLDYFNPVYAYPVRNNNDQSVDKELTEKIKQDSYTLKYGDCIVMDFGKDMDYRYIIGVVVNAEEKQMLLTIPNEFITMTSSSIIDMDKLLDNEEVENYYIFRLKEVKPSNKPIDLNNKAVVKQIKRNKDHLQMKNELCQYIDNVVKEAIEKNKPIAMGIRDVIFSKCLLYWDKLGYNVKDKKRIAKLLQANRLTFNAGFTPFRFFTNDKSKDKKLTFNI